MNEKVENGDKFKNQLFKEYIKKIYNVTVNKSEMFEK